MATSKLNEMLKDQTTPDDVKKSIKWLMGRIAFLQKNKTIPGALNSGSFVNSRLFNFGEMYLYHYDAKWKNKLPYWDAFPLVIPVKVLEDGWQGLNLHYLPPQMRISFLDQLVQYAKFAPGEKRMRMQITYNILENSTRLSSYIPCFKRYLHNHVDGRMMRIMPEEWHFAAYMPIAQWQKASAQKVYAESRKAINNRNNP